MSAGLWKTHSVDALNQSKSPMSNAFGPMFSGSVSGGSDGLSPRDQTENSVDSAAQPRAKIPSWYHRLHQSLMSMDDSDEDDSSLDDVDAVEQHPDRRGGTDDGVPIDSRSSLLASNGRAASVDADIHLESTESSLTPRRQRFAETPLWRRPLQQRSESVDVLTGNGLTAHVGLVGRHQQISPFSSPSRTPLSSTFRHRQHELSERQRTIDNDSSSGVGQPADKWSGQQQLLQQEKTPVTKYLSATTKSHDVNVSDNAIVNYSLTSSPPLPDSQPPDAPPSSFMSSPRRRHRQSIDDGGEATNTAQQREIGSQYKENDSAATACDDRRRGPTADIVAMETCTQTERELTDSTSDVLEAPLQQLPVIAISNVENQPTSQIVVDPQPTYRLNDTVSSDVQTGSLVERAVASKPVLGLRSGRQLPLSPAPVPEKSLFQPQRSTSIEQPRHTNQVNVVDGDKSKLVKATEKTPVTQKLVNVNSSQENSTMVRIGEGQASTAAAVGYGDNKSSSMTNLINKWTSLDAIDTTGYDRRYGGIPRSYAATEKPNNGPAKGLQQPPETNFNGSTSSWDTRPSEGSAVAVKSVTNVCGNTTTVPDEGLARNQSAVVPSTASGRLTSLITQPKKQYKWTVQEAKPLGRLISASETSTANRLLATNRPSTPSFTQTLQSDRQTTAPAAGNVYSNGSPPAILTSAPVPAETVRFQANTLPGTQRGSRAAEVDFIDYQQSKGNEERAEPTNSVRTVASPGGAGNDVIGRGNASSRSLTPGIKTVLARFKSVEALSTNQSLSEASMRASRGLPGRTTIQTSSDMTPYLLKSRSVENVASRLPMTMAVFDNENYKSDPQNSETESKTIASNDPPRKMSAANRNVMSESDSNSQRSIITPYAQIQLQKFRSMEEIPSETVIKRPASAAAAAATKPTAVQQSSSAVDARDDNFGDGDERRVPTHNVDSLLSAVAFSAAAAADVKRRQRPQSAGAARPTRGGPEVSVIIDAPAVSPSDGDIGRMTSTRTSADTCGRSAARQWSPIVRMASSDWSPYSRNTAPVGGTNDLQRYIYPRGSDRPQSPLVSTDGGTRRPNTSISTSLHGGQTAAATRQPSSGGRVLPRRPDELPSGNVSVGYRSAVEGEAVKNPDSGRSPIATIAATIGANDRHSYGSRPLSSRSTAVDRTLHDSRRSVDNANVRLNSSCTNAGVGPFENGSTNGRFNAATENNIVDMQPQTSIRPNFSTSAAVSHQPQLNCVTNNPTASPAAAAAAAEQDATPSWTKQRLAARSDFAVVDVADGGRSATKQDKNSATEYCKQDEQEHHLTNDTRLVPSSDVLDTDETRTATSSLFITLQIQPTCDSPSCSTMTSSSRPRTPSYLTPSVVSTAPPHPLSVSNSVSSIRVISTVKLNKSNAATTN